MEKKSFDRVEILLVDDRAENLLALEAVLNAPDYDLIKANSGDEALRYLLDHNPAVILMDVQMPGLDGYDTAAIIKGSERTREIPIIFVTAINADEHFTHEGYDHGAVDYIYKPYDAHILRSKVNVFAEMKRQRDRVSRLVAVQEAATRALADSTDVSESISKVLKSICGSLEWDLGLFWVFERRGGLLRCQTEWHGEAPDFAGFLAESFGARLIPGIDLPGRVWGSRKAHWVGDFLSDSPSARFVLASQVGLRTAVGLPVAVGDEILGVFEFFSSRKQKEDLNLLKIMGAIGNQVGQLLSRTKAFELVRAGEARKAAILETALDCIVSVDHVGRIIEFNPAAEATFGRSKAEMLGKLTTEMVDILVPPRYRAARRLDLMRCLAGERSSILGRRLEFVGMRPDGSEFPIELTVVRVETDDHPLFTGFLRDITERKKIERNTQLLAEASAALSTSFESKVILSKLAELSVVRFADWCRIDALAEGQALRTSIIAHREPRPAAEVAPLLERPPAVWGERSGVTRVVETLRSGFYPNVTEDLLIQFAGAAEDFETVRSWGVRSAMIVPLSVHGKALGAITFVLSGPGMRYGEDDLLVAEELARRAAIALDNSQLYHDAQNAINSRDEFFSIASHELKTPITSLKMQLEMTQRILGVQAGQPISPEKLGKMLTTSRRQVDRLTHLVEDLLDVVKIRAGKLSFDLRDMSLSDLVAEVLEGYQDVLTAAKCSVEFLDSGAGLGSWDRGRIEQVVVNLLGNAVKYAAGKPIVVEVSEVEGMARLVVRDQGPGIAPERKARIFERFERAVSSRNISGLGLGLFIAKQIVDAHHGSIRVESIEGEGSVFTVELPTKTGGEIRGGVEAGLRLAPATDLQKSAQEL